VSWAEEKVYARENEAMQIRCRKSRVDFMGFELGINVDIISGNTLPWLLAKHVSRVYTALLPVDSRSGQKKGLAPGRRQPFHDKILL
jgi:hypothetical protein